jgi:quinol monooxygenase YgiN
MYIRVVRGRGDPAKLDEMTPHVPDIISAVQRLPGCQHIHVGIDRDTGRTISVSIFDSREQAQYTSDSLGEPIARLRSVGWQPEPPEFYEAVT